MANLPDQGCELRVREGWQPITLEEALALHPSRIKRCPICHGQVRAHQAAHNGMMAHFEHVELHPGCYLGSDFDGNPRPHRKALK
jgi:hypothetical protein